MNQFFSKISLLKNFISLLLFGYTKMFVMNYKIVQSCWVFNCTIPVLNYTILVFNYTIPMRNNTIPVFNYTIPVFNYTIPVLHNTILVFNYTIPMRNNPIPVFNYTISVFNYTCWVQLIQTWIIWSCYLIQTFLKYYLPIYYLFMFELGMLIQISLNLNFSQISFANLLLVHVWIILLIRIPLNLKQNLANE